MEEVSLEEWEYNIPLDVKKPLLKKKVKAHAVIVPVIEQEF